MPTPPDAENQDGLTRPLSECLAYVFPTPLALHHWPDSLALNADLKAYIERSEAEERGAEDAKTKSNVGGWHSDVRFLLREEPCLKALRERIMALATPLTESMMMGKKDFTYQLEGWANVLRRGSYNTMHVHPGSTWSGVYYVTDSAAQTDPAAKSGNENLSGTIEFFDPRPGAAASPSHENRMQRRSVFKPPAGAMIIFPSWLQHMVHPYCGDEARLSVAFNVKVQ